VAASSVVFTMICISSSYIPPLSFVRVLVNFVDGVVEVVGSWSCLAAQKKIHIFIYGFDIFVAKWLLLVCLLARFLLRHVCLKSSVELIVRIAASKVINVLIVEKNSSLALSWVFAGFFIDSWKFRMHVNRRCFLFTFCMFGC
jgi:hypothetical protein